MRTLIFWLIGILILLGICATPSKKNTVPKKPVSEMTPLELLGRCMSYDKSIRQINYIIKESMHDPSSFEHVNSSHEFVKKDVNYVTTITTFRGKNLFGGLVLNKVKAKIYLPDCSVVEIKNIE